LLGIKNIVLAVNKMDLVGYDREIFWEITNDFKSYQSNLDFQTVSSIPLSALCGDNVVERSPKTPWYTGPTLISFLESLEKNEEKKENFCMPVQWVNRPSSEFRGYAGKVASGSINLGDRVKCLPSGEEAKVESILLYKESFSKARKNQSLTVTLDREIDCSRGSVIVGIDNTIELADKFEVELVWMDEDLGHQGRSYLLKSSVTTVGASISDIKFEYNINTMEHLSSKHLSMNAIASVTLTIDRPIPYQPYKDSPHLGSFVLIDRYKNSTAAAGMIKFALRRSKNIYPQNLNITRAARESLNGHKARVLWFTGLSGSGKSSIANLVEQKLHKKGIRTYVLDGDNLRHGLNKDLGFVESDRVENIRRVSEVAKLMHDAGLVVLVSFISPFRAERDRARVLFDDGQFLEIYVDTPIEIAEKRDIKGLYAKARRGEIPNFTGIDSPYEEPQSPEIRLEAGHDSLEACANKVVEYL